MAKKSRARPVAIVAPVPPVESTETEAIVLRFGAPLFGSMLVVPEMLCGECHRAGVLVVSVVCGSCHTAQVNRIMCLRSNVEVAKGRIVIHPDTMLCDDCQERDEDEPPPLVGGPLRTFNPSRLN
jgi:hypothetical protein